MKIINSPYKFTAMVFISLVLSACNGSDGGGASSRPVIDIPVGGYDASAGGFPALAQIPANNQQLNTCAALIPKQSGDLIGSVLYERRPMAAHSGLEASIELLPARGVVVEAVAVKEGICTQQVLATTLSDGNGEYAFSLAANTEVCVQVRAQLYRRQAAGGGGWDIQVTDNTRNNAPYYLLDNNPATVAAMPVRQLIAGSGWDGTSYSAARAAAPFAILDTACQVIDVLANPGNGLEREQLLPALKIRWSVDNASVKGDLLLGEIDTAFFRNISNVNELFLRGDSQDNSDEYDPHVIVHEMAHYISRSFLRADSLGGEHSLSELLDITTSFEEGWANAFAGIVLEGTMSNGNEVLFRDSLGANGYSAGGFYLDTRASYEVEPGWYSEGSIHRIIYDLYDADNSFSDRVTLPLAAIYSALKKSAESTALTSIYTFAEALLQEGLVSAADISRLFLLEDINGSGEYAVNETNSAGNADALPIYSSLVDGQTRLLCSNNDAGVVNRIGNYRYLQFTANMKRKYFFTLKPAGDPAEKNGVVTLDILRKGNFIVSMEAEGPGEPLSLAYSLPKGDYVIALSHLDNVIPGGDDPGRKCFTITLH